MPKMNEIDNGRGSTVSGGSFVPGENTGSIIEVHQFHCIYFDV